MTDTRKYYLKSFAIPFVTQVREQIEKQVSFSHYLFNKQGKWLRGLKITRKCTITCFTIGFSVKILLRQKFFKEFVITFLGISMFKQNSCF